ncbi:hypothetical protein HCN_1436 [Helicobacter cinaedi PAGU611]|nr:hypothetical protein HCN_1436 [Helicobacter cinaedi PAGU611]
MATTHRILYATKSQNGFGIYRGKVYNVADEVDISQIKDEIVMSKESNINSMTSHMEKFPLHTRKKR